VARRSAHSIFLGFLDFLVSLGFRALLNCNRSIENHIQRRPLPQFHFLTSRQQHRGKSDSASGCGAYARARPTTVVDTSDGGARAG
jgi:hypothetical protein